MDYQLSDVFDRHFEHIEINKKFYDAINKYQLQMYTSNSEHVQFFGGALLGVQVLRYTPKDVHRFFDTVLNIDYQDLESDIRRLNTIYHENSISGDILNLTLMYIIHRFYTAVDLNEDRRMKGAYNAALIFCYRCTFALTNNYFKYPVDKRVAEAAYQNLSNKHLIKKLGSWKKVCNYRAERIVEKGGLNYDRLYLFSDDLEVTKIIQDSQGRWKDIFRNYYAEFDKVHKDGQTIATTSSTITDADGDIVLRDKVKGVENLVIYIRGSLNDKNTFIKADLITLVSELNANTSYRSVKGTLEWMVDQYSSAEFNGVIYEFVADCVILGMHFLEHNVPLSKRKDHSYILKSLKNQFLATRSTDPQLMRIREQGEKLLKARVPNASESLISATRTAVVLYIFFRAYLGSAV